MIFVCIMGRTSSGKTTLESTLEQIGFKRNISYTTRAPRLEQGELEKDGDRYNFVSRDKFNELLDNGRIIESVEYNGNLYGMAKPFGSNKYVAVVETEGFKALKEIYGKQVVGIYLACDADIAKERAEKRDGSMELAKNRIDSDTQLVREAAELADITIDGNQDKNKVASDVLKALKKFQEAK